MNKQRHKQNKYNSLNLYQQTCCNNCKAKGVIEGALVQWRYLFECIINEITKQLQIKILFETENKSI